MSSSDTRENTNQSIAESSWGLGACDESGFSLLELLFTLALIGILTGMLTQSYSVYKGKAQHSSAIVLFNQARTSLESGKVFSENFTDAVMEVNFNGPGAPGGAYGETLLKELVVPENHQVYVRHVTNCASDLCIEDVISVRHCSTQQMATMSAFHNGVTVVSTHSNATLPCT